MASLNCVKKLLYICNLVFWLGGAALLGFGIWMKVDPTIVHYLNVINLKDSAPLISYAGLIFIVAGAAALLVGIFGCCGAMRESQGLIFLYIILLLLIMAAELAGGILALVYRNKIESELKDSMVHQIKQQYGSDPDVQAAWDHLQQLHECCGAVHFEDYHDSKWWNGSRPIVNGTTSREWVPPSCCYPGSYLQCEIDAERGQATGSLFAQGCFEATETWIKKHSLIMTILGLAIGGAQILGLIAACCLRNVLKASQFKS